MQKSLGFVLVILFVIFMHLPAHAQEQGNAYYDLGVFAYEDGDYEGAEINLKKALAFVTVHSPLLPRIFLCRHWTKSKAFSTKGYRLSDILPGILIPQPACFNNA